MKKFLAIALLTCLPFAAQAQTAVKTVQSVGPSAWVDLLNGPTEVMALEGSAFVFESGSTGVGSTSGSSTTLTLTGTPTLPPCVGCVISGTGITAGTTVAAFNGTTTVTLSAAMTVAASTALAWGVACPTTGVPSGGALSPAVSLTVPTRNVPLYSYARICAFGTQAGGTVNKFPVAAW